MAKQHYTDEQKAEFCEMAQSIGIGRTMRHLGYPKSYLSGLRWLEARGVKPGADATMQRVKEYHEFYQIDDLLMILDNSIATAEELLLTAATADDMNKLANALNKLVQTRQLIEGKSTAITEKREVTQADLEIAEMIRIDQAKMDQNKVYEGGHQVAE